MMNIMEEDTGEWSVVGKKDKKGSPKAQKKKGVKRTDLQRSTSSNQVNSRRKLESPRSALPEKEFITNSVHDANNTRRKSSRLAQTVSEDQKLPESVTLVHDTITTIIDDVSSGIRRLSIDNNVMKAQNNTLKYKSSVGVEPLANPATVLSVAEFCGLCKKFNASRSVPGRFQARGLLNTGCTCFWNCIMQSLFSVTTFKSLLLVLLQRLAIDDSSVHERLPAWREVLSLAAEFDMPLEAPASMSVPRPTPPLVAALPPPAPETSSIEKEGTAEARLTRSMASHTITPAPTSKEPIDAAHVDASAPPPFFPPAVSRHVRNSPVAATSLMSTLFLTFQRQMDGISGFTRDYTVGADNRKNKKNGQQDAMEFLTFLLDTLHEEIIRAEAEAESLAAEGVLPEDGIVRQDSLEMEIAMTRQNSLSVEAQQEDDDEGWSTVSKGTKATHGKSKVKAVVVDKESLERAVKASKASVISALFHFTLRSEVVYKVKKVSSVTFQQTHCLTLDVNAPSNGTGSGSSLELSACLANYFAEESIDEGKVRKQIKLDSLPEVLILQLGRFSFDYHKNIPIKIQNNVAYPAKLELPATCLSDELTTRLTSSRTANSVSPQYELQAVVLHHGKKATGGHYSAFTLDTQPGTGAVATAAGAGSVAGAKSTAPAAVSIPGLPPPSASVETPTKNKNGKAIKKVNNAVKNGGASAVTGGAKPCEDPAGAHSLRPTRVWRSVNDSKINVINESQALGAQDSVYILFYQKMR